MRELYARWVIGLALTVLGLWACGGEDAAPTEVETAGAIGAAAPDALRDRETANPELSAAERTLLLRAKGRNWRGATSLDLGILLGDDSRPRRYVYVWDERAGGEGLRAFQRAVSRYPSEETSASVMWVADEVSDDAVVSLRSSQIPYPAYYIPTVALESNSLLVPGHVILAGAPVGDGAYETVPLSDFGR